MLLQHIRQGGFTRANIALNRDKFILHDAC
jgi:hypothetical protein